eukprot:7045-Heterococcus_DN1.PRE.1
MFKNQSGSMRKSESRKLKIKDARPQMVEAELEKTTLALQLNRRCAACGALVPRLSSLLLAFESLALVRAAGVVALSAAHTAVQLFVRYCWDAMLLQWEQLTDMADVVKEAVQAVEESGIVFIDEIDKVSGTSHCCTYCYTYNSADSRACRSVDVSHYFLCLCELTPVWTHAHRAVAGLCVRSYDLVMPVALGAASDYRGADASAEGVQRDLLPLIEGSTISTKHGNVNTDFILFIGSGAFSSCKPSDLVRALQLVFSFIAAIYMCIRRLVHAMCACIYHTRAPMACSIRVRTEFCVCWYTTKRMAVLCNMYYCKLSIGVSA